MKIVVYQPLLTEKTLLLARGGWFSFVADKASTKQEIAQSIASLYGVKVTQVRTAIMHGKMRRVGKRQAAKRMADWKKAMVRLGEGQKIDAFELPEQTREEKK